MRGSVLRSTNPYLVMKILVVEDFRLTALILKKNLVQLGYRDVCLVGSTEEAMKRLKIWQFDLFIVDWMLPGASGVEFVRWLRSMTPYQHVPILMVTGNDTYDEVVEALEAGADDYLLKPVRQEVLEAKLKGLLGKKSSDNPDAAEPETNHAGPSPPELI